MTAPAHPFLRAFVQNASCAVASVAFALVSLPACAHDTWLAAEQRSVMTGGSLDLLMTSGERFPTLGSAISPQRIDNSTCRQGARSLSFKPSRSEPKALRLSIVTPSDGAVSCWVQLAPRTLNLAEATVAHYLDEIDAPQAVRAAWETAKPPKRWTETYTKNAKILVPGANAADVSVPDSAVGLKLELILVAGVGTNSGDKLLPVLVLLDGKPRGGLSIALTGEKAGKPQRLRSDAQGRVAFPLPNPGRWMLSATDLVARDAGKGEWESQFSTLVFEVPATSR